MRIESPGTSAFLILLKVPGFFVVAVRTMAAAAFAAVAALQMILLRKHDIAFGAIVEIFRVQLFFKHQGKDIIF